MKRVAMAALIAVLALMTQAVQAETKVTLSGLHLCCGKCTKAVSEAVDKVEGAKVEVDQDGGTASITADDPKVARKAIMAVARAGFFGKSDNDKLKIPTDKSGVEAGKVSRLELMGIHNCCGKCANAIKSACTSVDGVQGCEAKGKSLVVEGDFDGAAVVKSLNEAGFYARAKGTGEKKKKE